jgi:hypothetical protein
VPEVPITPPLGKRTMSIKESLRVRSTGHMHFRFFYILEEQLRLKLYRT